MNSPTQGVLPCRSLILFDEIWVNLELFGRVGLVLYHLKLAEFGEKIIQIPDHHRQGACLGVSDEIMYNSESFLGISLDKGVLQFEGIILFTYAHMLFDVSGGNNSPFG